MSDASGSTNSKYTIKSSEFDIDLVFKSTAIVENVVKEPQGKKKSQKVQGT